ncbi:M23 family metallopeptidase [Pusillimonas sp.]|uniref:M23 family metallopeptidase n=1 Tax=Pusillimonas sp. TaxID=3040095 RepID=UPI0039B8E269
MSAAAGAWVHSRYAEGAVTVSSSLDLYSANLARESDYSRGQVEILAAKLGDLQAKIIEMDGLSRRVAEIAGIPYTDPEIQAGLDQAAPPVMDYIGDAEQAPRKQKMSLEPGSGLNVRLDFLQQEVTRQKEWFRMMDLALTRRAGVEASLPTLMPVNYPYLSSSFGWRRHPISGRHVMHEGLDFAAPKGTPIHAASGGVVTAAGYKSGYGNMVEIYHGNDLVTRYAHASKLKVKAGDIVERGQEIAAVGSTGHSTGPHLHFEVRMAGHPLDPVLFLEKRQPDPTLVTDASGRLGVGGSKVR